MKFSVLSVAIALGLGGAVQAEAAVRAQDLQQGGFKLLVVPPSSTVRLGGASLPVVPGGEEAYVLVGFDRKEAATRWLEICPSSNPCTTRKLVVQKRIYQTQNVKGVGKAHREPDPKALKQMAADNAAINAARRATQAAATRGDRAGGLGFLEDFQRPGIGPITGVYGSARLFDGQERTWHKGLDYAAPTGTPVVAPAPGVVRLARSTFMSGNLVMLDHGANLSSVYSHLDTMAVKVGQVVRKGERLGTVGTTGRSSGPHLHWGLYVGSVAIDPQLWVAK